MLLFPAVDPFGDKRGVPCRTNGRYPARGRRTADRGAALLMTVFVVALLTTALSGIIHLNTEDIQVMTNHVGMVQALAIAEAGIEEAIAHKRRDPTWETGIPRRRFGGGTYAVSVDGGSITSTGRSQYGYETRVTVEITVLGTAPPHPIRIDALRLNR